MSTSSLNTSKGKTGQQKQPWASLYVGKNKTKKTNKKEKPKQTKPPPKKEMAFK